MSTSTLVGTRTLAAERAQRRPASPAELGKRLIPGYRITPAIAIISDALADAITGPDRRVIVTLPPRESKSTTVAVVGTLFALMRNPDERVILASYADSLAQEHSRAARALIAEHSETLGFSLSADKTSAARWQLDGRLGGLLAVGIMSGVTGFGAGLLLVDDAHKNAQDADSAAGRHRVLQEFRSTLMTRIHPGASVVIIGTRWAEADLIGSLLAEESDTWTHINIPAVAEAGIPDALDREPGVAMTSALGRTPRQFDDLRRSVASRSWYALFQGVPSNPEGGLVKQDWIDTWRLAVPPGGPVKVVIGVDPADSGEGDAAGIVAASLNRDGTIAIIADATGQFTAEQWSRRAVELAIETGASEIAIESFNAGTTYLAVVADALKRMRPARSIRPTNWPPKGSGRGRGDALARAAGLLQALEVGTARIAGRLPEFETAAIQWHAGRHCPDGLSAAVVAFDVLVHARGQSVSFSNPATIEARMRDRDSAALLGGRFGRVGNVTPIDARLTRPVSGSATYDPLAAPRKTLRNL